MLDHSTALATRPPPSGRLCACTAVLPGVRSSFEHEVIKRLVDRQRPGTSNCHGDASCGQFRDVPLVGESYVSGHAIISWSVATLLFPYCGRTGRIVVVSIAVANSVARVYLGAHNPLDVVGGGALGVVIGCLLLLVVDPVRRDTQRLRARGRRA